MVAHIYNLSTGEDETGGLWVLSLFEFIGNSRPSQSGVHRKAFSRGLGLASLATISAVSACPASTCQGPVVTMDQATKSTVDLVSHLNYTCDCVAKYSRLWVLGQ